MAVYSILQAQNVIAPSKFTTDGEFVAVANELSNTFVIVKRTINSSTVYYLEKFNESLTLDSAKTGAAASSVTMAHLNGKTVELLEMVFWRLLRPFQQVLTLLRSLQLRQAAAGRIRLQRYLEDHAGRAKAAAGHCQGVNKRIVQVDAIVHETQNMSINGKLVPFHGLAPGVLGQSVQEFTGTKTVHGLLGFSNTGQITITQSVPLKMTVLGIEYRMSVGTDT